MTDRSKGGRHFKTGRTTAGMRSGLVFLREEQCARCGRTVKVFLMPGGPKQRGVEEFRDENGKTVHRC